MLATHPDVSTIGERRKFYNKSLVPDQGPAQNCSCGKRFVDCEHWNAIKERFLKRVKPGDLRTNLTEFQFSTNRYWNRLGKEAYQWSRRWGLPTAWHLYPSKLRRLRELNQILVEEMLDLEAKNVFVDSSKIIDQAWYLSEIEAFDFYVVWLVRDPRAQVSSALKYNAWDVAEATRRWKREMEKNRQILERAGMRYHTLRYEALCREPREEMVQLLNFVGMDTAKFSLNFRSTTQHIMGNRSMRRGTDTKIVERRDWLDRRSREQIETIEKLTVDYRQYYTI